MLEKSPSGYLFLAISLVLYALVGYAIERHETVPLFLCYFSLFLLYLILIRRYQHGDTREIQFLIYASVFFRMTLLFSVPALSDDFYRFIWDGRLLAAGYHPFAEVPSYYMHGASIPGLDGELFEKLNSKERYTSYPPVCQLIYWASVKVSPGSVYGSLVVMKLILFFFETGTIWLFTKLLRHFHQENGAVLLYALNPLVILEIIGNVHFEGIMIFFLLLAILLLVHQRSSLSSLAFAMSVCTKLIPLLFLPLLLRQLGWKKAIFYWVMTVALSILLFMPLLNEDIMSLSTSLGYYFQRFEFNASIYYIIREVGFLIFGFNIIQFAGPLLALSATVIILVVSFRNLPSAFSGTIDIHFFTGMLWCLFVYFLSTTILHPWYIITLLAISVFTRYRFPLVWTGLIFLTYDGYEPDGFQENLLLVSLEYLFMIAYLMYETRWIKSRSL